MRDAPAVQLIRRKYRALHPEMDERMRRQWAATEARDRGWGGVTLVAVATGLSRTTITAGLKELALPAKQRLEAAKRMRRPGAGRPRLVQMDPEIIAALEGLLEPATRGDPMSPLRWTCKSTRRLADELTQRGHSVSPRTAASLQNLDGL